MAKREIFFIVVAPGRSRCNKGCVSSPSRLSEAAAAHVVDVLRHARLGGGLARLARGRRGGERALGVAVVGALAVEHLGGSLGRGGGGHGELALVLLDEGLGARALAAVVRLGGLDLAKRGEGARGARE